MMSRKHWQWRRRLIQLLLLASPLPSHLLLDHLLFFHCLIRTLAMTMMSNRWWNDVFLVVEYVIHFVNVLYEHDQFLDIRYVMYSLKSLVVRIYMLNVKLSVNYSNITRRSCVLLTGDSWRHKLIEMMIHFVYVAPFRGERYGTICRYGKGSRKCFWLQVNPRDTKNPFCTAEIKETSKCKPFPGKVIIISPLARCHVYIRMLKCSTLYSLHIKCFWGWFSLWIRFLPARHLSNIASSF